MPCVGVEDCYLILNLSEEILQICSLCGPRRQDLFFPWLFKMLNCKSSRVDPESPEGDLGENIV